MTLARRRYHGEVRHMPESSHLGVLGRSNQTAAPQGQPVLGDPQEAGQAPWCIWQIVHLLREVGFLQYKPSHLKFYPHTGVLFCVCLK